MKAKARQRANWKTSSVKSPHKVNASFGKKRGIVMSDGIILGNRRKMIVARSEEKNQHMDIYMLKRKKIQRVQ